MSSPTATPRRGDEPAVAPNFADQIVDELLPASLDWRHLVRKYPHAAVVTAAALGFWLGRRKSDLVIAAVTSYLGAQLGDVLGDLGDERG
ncbi:MAG TPA: hypothetical protein VGV61_10080 [Thermoanaerobaculia bacterium]|nr:hypothetical protein [Thermoanaerobaculia bacterium]